MKVRFNQKTVIMTFAYAVAIVAAVAVLVFVVD